MGKALERDKLIAVFSDKNEFLLDSVKPGSPKIAIWECPLGHEWKTAVRKVIQNGQRCPYCQNKKCLVGFNDLESQRPDLLKIYDFERNPDPSTIQATHNHPVHWRCSEGHEWEEKPFWVCRTTADPCPVCKKFKKSIAGSHPEMLSWLLNPEDSETDASSRKTISLKCNEGHIFEESPGVFRKDMCCKFCQGTKVLSGFNDLGTLFPQLADEWDDEAPIETVSVQSSLRAKWKCAKCGYRWEAFVYNRTSGSGECFKCAQKSGSKPQRELGDFVESLGFKPQFNVKSVLPSQKELDIYIPELKIGIEYNGIYWHGTLDEKDKNRHYDKWIECEQAGIKLLVVWSDDWENRQAIVTRMLKSKLGKTSEETVYARNTEIVELSSDEARNFLTVNHIQGYTSGRHYGLRNKSGDPVAVLTVQKYPSMKGYLNIARFATSLHVPGGFTKILSHVEKKEKPRGFVTFSDNSISAGELYSKAGFVNDRVLGADYSYCVKGERVHKFNYRLKRFRNDSQLEFVEGLSESRLATLNGISRVYDYGKKRWIQSL